MRTVTGSVLQVSVSVPSRRIANEITHALLEQHLCACVQVLGPMRSSFRWQGKVETVREYLLLIKTRKSRMPQLERVVRQLHPYDVPEILTMTIEQGNASYLDWLRRETG